MNTVVWMDAAILSHFMTDAFVKIGVPRKDAAFCADVILEADKRGIESHGVGRFKTYYYDRIKTGIQLPKTTFEIIRQNPTTAVIDGNNGMGHIVAKKSMELAIKKAKRYGMGMVVARNSTHYGIAGYYAAMATAQDMIGILGTNTRAAVAPTFGVENMLGTNPLAFAFPTDEKIPYIFDAATSLSQLGKVSAHARRNKQLPDGWVIDRNGDFCTDPHRAHEGLTKGTMALTPFGGYKGYGLATVVELLSAALSGGSYLRMLTGVKDGKKVPIPISHFFIVLDIKPFLDPAKFKKTAGNILKELRGSRKMPGQERIYTAGEKGYEMSLTRATTGIPLQRVTQEEFLKVQQETGLTKYHFPFSL